MIDKINLNKETIKREKALLPEGVEAGFDVLPQQFNVIEDKLNEIISQVNLLIKGREEGK